MSSGASKWNSATVGKAAIGVAAFTGFTWLAVRKYWRSAAAATTAATEPKITITVTAPQPAIVVTNSTPSAGAAATAAAAATSADTKKESETIPFDRYYFGYGSNML